MCTDYTLLGSLMGVLVFSLTKSFSDVLLKPAIAQSSNPWANSPYFILALPIVAMFGITACAFETLIPSENEIKFSGDATDSVWAYNVWPPYICGMLVGGLQVPMVLIMSETLGGSSSLSFVVAQLFIGPLEKLSSYAAKFRRWNIGNYWQIFYIVGAALGAYMSASVSGTLGQNKGVSVAASFLGGFLMYIGARIGGGCNSGHGLSGMGLLSILSFIMIAATFASGISSAFLLQWYSLL